MKREAIVVTVIGILGGIMFMELNTVPSSAHFSIRTDANTDVYRMDDEKLLLADTLSENENLEVITSNEEHYIAVDGSERVYIRKEDAELVVEEPFSLETFADLDNGQLIHDFSNTTRQHIPYEYELLSTEQAKKYADRALKGDWYIPSEPYQLQVENIDTFDWHTEIPTSIRNSYPFQIHYLTTLNHLTQAYNDTGEVIYLKYGLRIISSWTKAHPISKYEQYRWPYNDHGTAIRTFHLINFWEAYKNSELHRDPNVTTFMMRTIYEHGSLLAQPGFYKAHHNHGVFQDMALTAIAQTFPEFDLSGTWIELANRRLGVQFEQSFSKDAVHLEHSPGYQAYMYHAFARFLDWADSNKFTLPSSVKNVENMPKQLAYMIKPNSTFPIFGDTSADVLDLDIIPNTEDYPELTYVVSQGATGSKPRHLSKKIGTQYSFMREYWEHPARPFSDAVQIMMTAGFHSNAHKHADDLTLDVYGFGRDFIIETGRFGYTNRPERKQVFDVEAHNTVHRAGDDLDLSPKMLGKSQIVTVKDRGASSIAWGKSELIGNGAIHQRKLVYDKAQTLLVYDRITSPSPDKYVQRFHMAEGLKPTMKALEEQNVIYADDKGRSIQLMQLNLEGTSMETGKSYVAARDYEWVERDQVMSHSVGKNVHYLTLIRLDKGNKKITEADVRSVSGKYVVTYHLSDQSRHELSVPIMMDNT